MQPASNIFINNTGFQPAPTQFQSAPTQYQPQQQVSLNKVEYGPYYMAFGNQNQIKFQSYVPPPGYAPPQNTNWGPVAGQGY